MKTRAIGFGMFLLCLTTALTANSQSNDDLSHRMYRTIRMWGYVKYYHSRVSICQVNWDSVLLNTISNVQAAHDSVAVNNALLHMLHDAGPMAVATTPALILDSTSAINVDHHWYHDDPYYSPAIRANLDSIRDNFRPHPVCWIKNNDYSGSYTGWVTFHDDTMLLFGTAFNNEYARMVQLTRYWNDMKYFNPNSKILDRPWDSIFYDHFTEIDTANVFFNFDKGMKKMVANLSDTHADGLSYSYDYALPNGGYYSPDLTLTFIDNQYVVSYSADSNIRRGDVLDSIDRMSMLQWEDSVRPYVSASNISTFKRDAWRAMVQGPNNSIITLAYTDSNGVHKNQQMRRKVYYADEPHDTLTKFKTISCDVGYVDLRNLQVADVTAMYDSLKDKKAIIFDVRNYPNGVIWRIDSLLLQRLTPEATFLMPDVTYPGNFTWAKDSAGPYDANYQPVPNPNYYKGKVIILMNEQTQSHAEFTCMHLEANPDVVKIGSQTAGADGNVSSFSLNTDMQMGYTSLGIYYPDGTNAQRTGIVPDILVKPTLVAFRQGRDEVLEKALEVACTTGISEVEEAVINVFPNPASQQLNVSVVGNTETLNLKIANLLGEELYHQTMTDTQHSIDVATLPVGFYILQITNSKMVLKNVKWVKGN